MCEWEGRAAKSCKVLGSTPDEHRLEVHEWGRGATRVYLVGGIHGNEGEGQTLVERMGRVLEDDARLRGVTLRVLRDLNPDGLSKGSRYNSSGVDLNRNWPADNFRPSARNGRAPLSEVEVSLAHADMLAFEPDVIIVFHSSARGPFVNFDGPAESMALAFARGAYTHDPAWKVVADMGYPTPGSLGSYWGVDRGLPVLTIEFRRDQEPGTALEAGRAGLLELLRELSSPTLASHP